MSGEAIELLRRSDRCFVEATLFTGLAPTDFIVIGQEWASERSLVMQDLLKVNVPRHLWPESLHWNWEGKAPELKLLESSGFGIACDGQWQGCMMTRSASYFARLSPDHGKPLVYVDFLEVAPWNWKIPEVGRSGRFRSIGSILLKCAIRQSINEGFHGRLGLHSLPQSERFYEREFGMTPLKRDRDKQNLLYLELSADQAARLLDKGDGGVS